MEIDRKSFNAVAAMRKTRDKLSRRFRGMTFAEQKCEMKKLAKYRSGAEAGQKRRTA